MGASGGGHIDVNPAALDSLAQKLRSEVQEGKASASEAGNKAQVPTGNAKLDASLGGFTRAWGGLMNELAHGGEELTRAIEAAASNYRQTEASVMRTGSGQGGGTS